MIKSKIIKNLYLGALSISFLQPTIGVIAGSLVSFCLKRRVDIFFDCVWMRRDGETTIPLEPEFWTRFSVIKHWLPNAADKVDVVAEWWFLRYTPTAGDIVIDVGAGMGEDTLLFSRLVGATGYVYGFDDHPHTHLSLGRSLAHSHVTNASVVHSAIYSENCTLEIEDLPTDRWLENSVVTGRFDKTKKSISVPAIKLDDFQPVQGHAKIDFLKMNIEGAEIDALLGMPDTLAKVQNACIACHDFLSDKNINFKTKDRCAAILKEAGFEVFEAPRDSPPWQRDHLHATRAIKLN